MATLSLSAQTYSQSFNLCNKTYTASCEQMVTNKIKISLVKADDDSGLRSIAIVTTDIEQFARSFQIFFKEYIGNDAADCNVHDKDTTALVFGRQLYLNFLASLTKDADVPVAGIFTVKDSTIVHVRLKYLFYDPAHPAFKLETIPPTGFNKKYKIEKVAVEFNNGFIENIKAYLNVDGQIHVFTNAYPFGISSVSNFKRYADARLFDMDSHVYLRPVSMSEIKDSIEGRKGQQTPSLFRFDSSYSVLLGDLINYDYYLGVDRRDYSPKDDTITLMGKQASILHKEATNRLFEAHIFTDFIGLNEDKPNGLIQTEVSKRINLNTKQHLSKPWFYWLARSRGGFQYIEPTITLSKLEQHNKRLLLGDLDSIRFNPGTNDTSKFGKKHRYVTALDLYQYQTFSAGIDVNIGYWNNHDIKFAVYLNTGFRLGITSVTDSLTTVSQNTIAKTGQVRDFSINTFQFYPSLIFTFLPEERFNLSIKEQVMYIKALNTAVQPLYFDKLDETKAVFRSSSWLNMLELLMTIQVSANSKMFGRLKFNSDMHNAQNNFAQVQVGYSTYILGGGK